MATETVTKWMLVVDNHRPTCPVTGLLIFAAATDADAVDTTGVLLTSPGAVTPPALFSSDDTASLLRLLGTWSASRQHNKTQEKIYI